MKHLLNYTEWESGSGRWYCNDVTNLGTVSSQWWVPARMLGISPAKFVALLIEKYKPDYIEFSGKTLIYSWSKDNQQYCHKFVKFINETSKKMSFLV